VSASAVSGIVVTTAGGIIEWIDDEGAALLNMSATACVGRRLLTFIAQDRLEAMTAMAAAAIGQRISATGLLRPFDCRPVSVAISISPDDIVPGDLIWRFTRSAADAASFKWRVSNSADR
jgi:hypothetical protein